MNAIKIVRTYILILFFLTFFLFFSSNNTCSLFIHSFIFNFSQNFFLDFIPFCLSLFVVWIKLKYVSLILAFEVSLFQTNSMSNFIIILYQIQLWNNSRMLSKSCFSNCKQIFNDVLNFLSDLSFMKNCSKTFKNSIYSSRCDIS